MSSNNPSVESVLTPIPASRALMKSRAKYIPDGKGGWRLAMVQTFSFPIFKDNGLEELNTKQSEQMFGEQSEAIKAEYARRALRRAKVAAFDLILCNNDLDTFCTFTYRPEGNERSEYDDVYKKLSVWCSNAVQRRGLKYVAVPEYHKDAKSIHFHMLANHSALQLIPAHHKGRSIIHTNGNPIYNIEDWRHGFSTAVDIRSETADRDAVAKYIFKYMGKQEGQKIGGRYFLHGGKLAKPIFRLADTPEVFFDGAEPKYHRELDILDGATYSEWSFV